MTDKGQYLEAVLPHLSFYALTGTNEAETNPSTLDGFAGYAMLIVSSLVGAIGVAVFAKKR
jgi:hypothetical protein